jgi:hypothetical protein
VSFGMYEVLNQTWRLSAQAYCYYKHADNLCEMRLHGRLRKSKTLYCLSDKKLLLYDVSWRPALRACGVCMPTPFIIYKV